VVSLQQSFGASAGSYVDLQYDAADQLTTIVRAIGSGATTKVRTVQSYDSAGRITTQIYSKVVTTGFPPVDTVTPLATYIYGYDAASRLTTQVDAEGTATFGYDITNQLTSVGGSRSETYGFDANGNRNTTGYTVVSGNRYSSGGGFTYTYDAEGNQTGKTEITTGNVWTNAFDFHNRLTGVTEKNSGGSTIMQATYTYDALGRRIGTKVDDDGSGPHAAVQTWMVYDRPSTEANTYADFDGSGNLLTRYLYAPAVDALLARTSSGGTTAWYLPDKLGSIRDIADTSGALIDHVVYNSFGGVTSESNSANGDRFKFTGREYDSTTGLYYFRARYYDPLSGRYISLDPKAFGARDSNLYRYVWNDPPNFRDVTGLDPDEHDVAQAHNPNASTHTAQSPPMVGGFLNPSDPSVTPVPTAYVPRMHQQMLRDVEATNNPQALQELRDILRTARRMGTDNSWKINGCMDWTRDLMQSHSPKVIRMAVVVYHATFSWNPWDGFLVHQVVELRLPGGQVYYIDDGWFGSVFQNGGSNIFWIRMEDAQPPQKTGP
jgi:RHS repeat-associated protein